ncbi:MAG: PilZ domain-containing protein [Microthrixaceae bacterium]
MEKRPPPDTRRLGERLVVEGVTLDWDVPRGRTRRRLGRRKAEVVDVSSSGARLLAPRDPDMAVGRIVRVALDGEVGVACIRRVETAEKGRAAYGVEWLELTYELRRVLTPHLQEPEPAMPVVEWRR